ncbi:hypothetical protein N7520_011255 [Penicillium odoratum]|uniref:uncharacterized protein n=1 Tax=Penicillium odoratum TaxID=1167516 RepID=UPI002547DBA1|nr:uncharacterized protein N7520_011255 [Penicillium odoratum]KAJ5746073.1 hypothetical protein N7520_011255 [Penicillium odoratum]
MPPQRQSSFKENTKQQSPGTALTEMILKPKRRSGRATKITGTAGRSLRGQKDSSAPNIPPTQRLDVYVFGTNCYGELGIAATCSQPEIKRGKCWSCPYRCWRGTFGGSTHDNQILTWGVNDEGALGRDTGQDKDEDAGDGRGKSLSGDESDEDEVTYNLKEATPLPVDPSHFPRDTVFSQLAASDSATFALLTDGRVYGWGTFRTSKGGIGFSPESKKEQRTPLLIPGVHDVVKIVTGAQHVLALTSKGTVFSWGCDEQNQLGRRRTSRHHKSHPLVPELCALPTEIQDIGVGLYHSFAICKKGHIYAWGSNNFGQTGVTMSAGQNDAIVSYPAKVPCFQKHTSLVSIFGEKDHSKAITELGECLVWGRIDNMALGLALKDMPQSDIIYDTYGRPRILKQPNLLTGVGDKIVSGTVGTDHSFVITESGKAYSRGFNSQSQAGQPGLDEVEKPTLLHSKYLEGKNRFQQAPVVSSASCLASIRQSEMLHADEKFELSALGP